jgi:carbon storage regulator
MRRIICFTDGRVLRAAGIYLLQGGNVMLVLSRKSGETIVIGDDIRVTVLEIRGNSVKLGLAAPREVPLRRAELPVEEKPECHSPATVPFPSSATFVIEALTG